MSVRARAIGLDGKVIRINADELLAQALEHEIDHLGGTLYIDRLVSPDQLWKFTPVPEDEEEDGEDGAEAAGGETSPTTEGSDDGN